MTALLRSPRLRTFLGLSAMLVAACGGRTESDGQNLSIADPDTGGATSYYETGGYGVVAPQSAGGYYWAATGGYYWTATGGYYWTSTGGYRWSTGGTPWTYATGGRPSVATGGSTSGGTATGGKTYTPAGTASTGGKGYTGGSTSTGGKGYAGGGTPAGGTTSTGGNSYSGGGTTSTGGTVTGGATTTGGTSGISCASVTCPSIPSTCTQIVQPLGACCPTCLNPNCPICDALVCPTGTHSETAAGDCCPKCVDDPPDACTTGQKTYASMRQSMIDKYSSSGCSNSLDCVLVPENNACAFSCGVPLPNKMSSSFQSNLDSQAKTSCSTCKPPDITPCVLQVAACVNGKCVAVSPS